jgi:hypothetical protein
MNWLSTKSTYFYKFCLPIIWFFVACAAVVWFCFIADSSSLLFLFPVAVSGILLFWLFVPLKKVAIDGQTLIISNFKQEIRIPLSSLQKASGSTGMNPELIKLHLKQDTCFGKTIVFMPNMRILGGYSQHPLVSSINKLVAASNLAGT